MFSEPHIPRAAGAWYVERARGARVAALGGPRHSCDTMACGICSLTTGHIDDFYVQLCNRTVQKPPIWPSAQCMLLRQHHSENTIIAAAKLAAHNIPDMTG